MIEAEDALVFDAGKLHEQLANLLKLYLKRAADPDAVAKCSAKDALACAKALTAMMSDLQSGRLKSWSGGLQTATPLISRPGGRESVPMDGGTGVPPVIHPNPPARRRCHQISTSTSILDDALNVVLSTDEESHIPEPHQRFIARADRLCKEVRKRLDKAQDRVRPPIQADDRRSCRLDSRRYPLGDSSVGALRLGVTVPVAAGDGDRAIRELPQQSNNQKPTTNNDSVPGLPVEDSPVLSNNQKLTTNNGVRAKARTLT